MSTHKIFRRHSVLSAKNVALILFLSACSSRGNLGAQQNTEAISPSDKSPVNSVPSVLTTSPAPTPTTSPATSSPTSLLQVPAHSSAHSLDSYEEGASEASRLHVQEEAIKKLCKEIAGLYKRNAWGRVDPCLEFNFKVFGWSEQKRPLVYYEAGNAEATKLTLIQCGIHGDELPTLPMCLRLIAEIREGKRKIPSKTRIWIQPLLNPDGMLAAKPTRTNANGVDINRNFPTKDWSEKALALWKTKEKESERKYPGEGPLSQSETRAIVDVIESFKPQKIISIHTPLGFLDLDAQGGDDIKRRAKFLAINMSKNSGNYKFLSFGFYPGSLGNYAGQERQIPVYTLELPPGGSRATVDSYWKKFRLALWRAIDFDLETGRFQED